MNPARSRYKPKEGWARPHFIGMRPTSTLNDLPSPIYRFVGQNLRGLNAEELNRWFDRIQQICTQRHEELHVRR